MGREEVLAALDDAGRSMGSASTVRPLPVMVVARNRELYTASSVASITARNRGDMASFGSSLTARGARNRKVAAKIGLPQRPHCPAALRRSQAPGGGSDPALETERYGASSCAHRAFLDGAASRALKRRQHFLPPHRARAVLRVEEFCSSALEQLAAGQTAPAVARIVHLSPQAVRGIAHRYHRQSRLLR